MGETAVTQMMASGNDTKRVMIVAGEASGDMYGARLVEESLQLCPELTFFGIGGNAMRAAGVETLIDANEMAVMGLVEVISHFRIISRAFVTLKRILVATPPDLLILIDYPGFNLRLAAAAKKAGVKVLYYISPKVWAWRPGRAQQIARNVDHVAVIFPFEVPIYQQAGVPVTFVGHPLLDMVKPSMGRDEAVAAFGLDPERRTVGLFPGSRRSELKLLMPVLLASAGRLKDTFNDLQFILPLASGFSRADLLVAYPELEQLGVRIIAGKNYDVMQVCTAIIAASGTVTMEIALLGVPMVIVYKVAPLTYAIGRRIVKIEHMGICNIVAGERIVPELMQQDAEPGPVSEQISRYLADHSYAEAVSHRLAAIRELLGSGGASQRVAELVVAQVTNGNI